MWPIKNIGYSNHITGTAEPKLVKFCIQVGYINSSSRTFAEIWPFFDFQDGGRPPSWICFTCILTTYEVYLMDGLCHFVKCGWNRCSSFDNMPILMFCKFGLKMPIHTPFWVFWGIWPPRRETISTMPPKEQSTGHHGSIGGWMILVSVVVPEKLPGQKRCEKEVDEHEFWAISASLYNNPDMTICNIFISMCLFCGGWHTDTNVWSILLFLVSQGVAKIQP